MISFLKKRKKEIARLFPYFLCFFVFLLLLPWLRYPFAGLFSFLNGSFSVFYRVFVSSIFIVYLVILLICYGFPRWSSFWVVFIYSALFCLLMIFVCPKNFSASIELVSGELAVSSVSIGWATALSYYGEIIFSLLFIFACLYILPVEDVNQKVFLWFWICIGVACVLFSFATEYSKYFMVFRGDGNRYKFPIRSFFESKNGFGNILFNSCGSCLLLSSMRKGKASFYWMLFLFFLIITGLIGCSSAFVSEAVSGFLYFLYCFSSHMKKHPKVDTILLALFCFLLISFCILLSIPHFRQSGILYAIFNKIATISFASVQSRFHEWSSYFSIVSGWNLLTGLGPAGNYLRVMLDAEGDVAIPLHNGFIDIFNAGGIFLLTVYLLFLFFGFNKIAKISQSNHIEKVAIASIVIGFLIYSLGEVLRLALASSVMSIFACFVFFYYSRVFGIEFSK